MKAVLKYYKYATEFYKSTYICIKRTAILFVLFCCVKTSLHFSGTFEKCEKIHSFCQPLISQCLQKNYSNFVFCEG